MAKKKITWDDIETHFDEARGVMTLTRGDKSLEVLVFPAEAVAKFQAITAQIYAEKQKGKRR